MGDSFATALAAKDFDRILDLLHPEVDFRGLTPGRDWQAADAETVVGDVLRQWFEESDEIEALLNLETDSFADRERVGYRFQVRNPEGLFEVEQELAATGRLAEQAHEFVEQSRVGRVQRHLDAQRLRKL